MLTKTVCDRIPVLLGADTLTFSDVDGCHVVLIQEAWTPDRTTAIAGLTPASFTDSAAKDASSVDASQDPLNGDELVNLLPPVGGWRWEATNGTNLPQTIFGYAVYTDSLTLDTVLLDEPIELTAANQAVDLGSIIVRIPNATLP